jgi:hypothetical protein
MASRFVGKALSSGTHHVKTSPEAGDIAGNEKSEPLLEDVADNQDLFTWMCTDWDGICCWFA